jgi:PAS domain S-box-containing protein
MVQKELHERIAFLEDMLEKQHAEIDRLKAELNAALLKKPDEHDKMQLRRFRQVVEQSPSMFVITDGVGKIEYINDRFTQILGYNREEVLDKIHVITTKDEHGRDNQTIVEEALIANGRFSGEFELEKKNGDNIWVRARITPVLNDESIDFYVCVFDDLSREISEKNYADKMAKIQYAIDSLQSIGETFEKSLAILFDNLFHLDWLDAGGLYLVNNEKEILELIYQRGLSDDFVRNTSVYSFSSPNAQVVFKKTPRYVTMGEYLISSMEDIKQESITFVASLPLVYQDKVLGLLNLASRKVADIDENDKQAIETIALKIGTLIELIKTRMELDRSNTELNAKLRELSVKQQILVQKSRLESLGELSAGLAHEINQPLSVISLALENIQYKLQQKATSGEYLARKFITINQNINKIRELIDHVRIFSRDQGTIMFERVDVNKVIINALSMIESQLKHHQIKISLELSDHLGFTVGNPSRFEQVILNLLSNARDALVEKEKIYITDGFSKEVRIKTFIEDEHIIIQIRDNGTGISLLNLGKIFIPFFTTKDEGHGTGLGLPIVYGIVREMKGEISARSDEGVFTEINITLPQYKNIIEEK